DRRQHGAVRDAVPEEPLARLQARAPHAYGFRQGERPRTAAYVKFSGPAGGATAGGHEPSCCLRSSMAVGVERNRHPVVVAFVAGKGDGPDDRARSAEPRAASYEEVADMSGHYPGLPNG